MLRPSDSLLYSSRAARRSHARAERSKAVASSARGLVSVVRELFGFAFDALLLFGLPVLYLAACYFALDLPARWLFTHEAFTVGTVLEFLGAILVSLVALARVLQQAPPVQPVTPQFARKALVAGWLAALLFAIADVAG